MLILVQRHRIDDDTSSSQLWTHNKCVLSRKRYGHHMANLHGL